MGTQNQKSIHITENFPVSKETLYQAWTQENELKKWWKPLNKTLISVENDINQGGKLRYTFENDLIIEGEYKEAKEGSRLVYSWIWNFPEESIHKGEYLLTVVFDANGESSTLNITQENFTDEHAIKPHEQGWRDSLVALKEYVTASKQEA